MNDEQRAEIEALVKADPVTRARRAGETVAALQEAVVELSRVRREALNELVGDGRTHSEIAGLLGMTRGRVGQLLSSGPKPERALLGTGDLTVAAGGKSEPQKATDPRTALSSEAHDAYKLIADAAKGYDLQAELEIVPPPGMVQLNRPNLVVLSSPRILPLVGQVLESDGNLGWGSGAQGWYLTEQDKVHRSPSDRGEPADYAYVGRLPRPDGKGTFLYLAGIHAMGTLGAAHWLTGNLETLYPTVKGKRWSVLIECRYDPDTRIIETTTPMTQVYTA